MLVTLHHPLCYNKVSFWVFLVLFQFCTLYFIQKNNHFLSFWQTYMYSCHKVTSQKRRSGPLVFKKNHGLFDHWPPWWLFKVDWLLWRCFPHTSPLLVTYFSTWEKQAKWVLVNNFLKRILPQIQTSVSFFLFFLIVLSVFNFFLDKIFSIVFAVVVKLGPFFYSVRALFHFIQSTRMLFYSEWDPFSKQKGPFPPMFGSRLDWMSLYQY